MAINNNRFLVKNGLDNNSKTITNVADPVNAQDAATRAYVLANTGSSITLTNDTTTNSDHYLSLTTATSGTLSALKVSSSKLAFNPSTGNLTVGGILSSSDIISTRAAAPTTGYIYFGNTGTKYCGFDGTNFVTSMPMNFSILGSSASCTGNAASATLATKASTLSQSGGNGTAMTFNWSGQGGQPSWLWGGNDGSSMYVYNPSNFSVNYSTTSGTSSSCSGNSATATTATNASNLHATRSTWSTYGTITACVGQLAWKNFGNGHTIFDASNGTSPDGTAVNSSNSAAAWQASYPTLMGWNGTQTHGVRVDSARVADSASSATTCPNYLPLAGGTMSGNIAFSSFATTTTIGNGTGDGASYATYNLKIRSHWGIGFPDYTDTNRIVFDTRTGDISIQNTISCATVSASSSVYANNWFRSNGTTGWFNETYSGGIYMSDGIYVRTYNNKSFVAQSYVEIANNYGTVSGAQNINVLNGSMVSMTLNGATTYTFSGAPSAGNAASFTLELTNGGNYTVTWPSGTKWSSGTPPTLTTSGTDILTFYTRDGGTTWRGIMVSKDSR